MDGAPSQAGYHCSTFAGDESIGGIEELRCSRPRWTLTPFSRIAESLQEMSRFADVRGGRRGSLGEFIKVIPTITHSE
jgi:hypothetical protein